MIFECARNSVPLATINTTSALLGLLINESKIFNSEFSMFINKLRIKKNDER